MKKIIIYFLTICFFSCVQDKQVKTLESKIDTVDIPVETKNGQNQSTLLNDNINLQSVKNQIDNATTTFLSKEDIIFFPDRIKNNFYGYYTLIKNSDSNYPTRIIGNMIVYDSINPYTYEKNTDQFVEITLNDKGVSLFNNKIEVGASYSKIIEEFGSKYQNKDNTLIFTKNNKIAFFKFKDSLVSKIKIGEYRKDIDVELMLKHFNW
ncbi:hypothetical protein ACFO3O_11995 [Dokdonia ponticola]|uniref:DUF4738 domain-containing protein n=1 Tax=Dokdonia ponticola TaxID=2041041 RepID=A0ABV9HZ58_9FLAO